MVDITKSDIKFLPGVGPHRAEILQREAGISTYYDLLYYFPFRYDDRTRFYKISEITGEMPYIQVRGWFLRFETIGIGVKKRLTGYFVDETGTLELVWFKGINQVQKAYLPGIEYVLYGKPVVFGGRINVVHPEAEKVAEFDKRNLVSGFMAVYPTTEKMKNAFLTSRTIQKLVALVFSSIGGSLTESLPDWFVARHNLMHLHEAMTCVHSPTNNADLAKARYRLKFEELFFIQLNILRLKNRRQAVVRGFVFGVVGHYFNTFYANHLKFEPTNAQKKVIREIRNDLRSGKQMNRLLQGDVGSGKTLVALMLMLIAADNGFQSVLMAPTEILARQHLESISAMVEPLGLKVTLLTGSTRKKERAEMLEGLKSGSIKILIGTHALIEDWVELANPGLVIIDEQHRFGVAQRAKLWAKSEIPPHVLVMTATPIPRTLAMTVYGDLDVSIIDELPPGRKPIKTVHYYDNRRDALNRFLREELAKGRQVYIVYPMIKESETVDYKNLEEGFEYMQRHFPQPQYLISMVHGKMKPKEKQAAMAQFVSGQSQILVSTTVIEVGVNVPNASVMVIESSERFGLSQLHQLRGRVGRGADQSYCVLMSGVKLADYSRKRLETMVATNDGFEIAEADMRLRGPGDIEGTQQSGLPFDLKIANLGRDTQVLQMARDAANEIVTDDPLLENPRNRFFVQKLQRLSKSNTDWSQIS